MLNTMNEKDFFEEILFETREAFSQSCIKIYQTENKKNWNYAVCDTPIQKQCGIIVGLNWGGDDINAQINYPSFDEDRNWNFVSNSRKYIAKYLKTKIEQTNYTNLCFFRSPNIKFLTWEDWESSFTIFKRYVEYIHPPWTLLLGSSGISKLKYLNYLTQIETITIMGKTKKTYAYAGVLFEKYKFYCLPHPQARISTETRDKTWERLFEVHKLSG